MNAIEARGLCKRYGGTRAVDDLRFEVAQGEVFALLGVNGAGKSTAVRMLSGLTPPDAGDALLMGRSVARERAEVRRIVGLSPQESAVAPRLTTRENLELIAGLYGLPGSRAAEVLEAFGLAEVAGRAAGKLSGGWQRRLSIAMALLPGPRVLFLDEPTLGLDVLARRALWDLIESLRGRVTVLLTTHYMEEAEALSDRVGILRAGRLTALGTAEELKARARAASFEDAFVALAATQEVE